MAESVVATTEGAGKNFRTFQRTVGGNTIEEQYVLLGDPGVMTYTGIASAISTATSASHLLQIAAGSSYNVRIHEIRVKQVGNAGSVAMAQIQMLRLTSAGTGGSGITFRPHDSTDDPAGVAGMTLPSSKGTEGVVLHQIDFPLRAAVVAAEQEYVWTPPPGTKPYIIPAGTANGVAFKMVTGVATSTVSIRVLVTQTLYL